MKEVDKGYIALFRQFVDWEWYDDANTMRLFIHCLLLANYKDKKWRGKIIKRGQFITSQPKLAHSLKLSIKQIRGSLAKLKTTGEVAVLTTPEYSVITVKNYDWYQNEGRQKGSQMSQEGQTEGRQRATTNKDNNTNRNNNISSSSSSIEISEEDEEILKKYSFEKNKVKCFRPWLRKISNNGDLAEVLEKAKKWQEGINKKKSKEVKEVEEKKLTPEEQKREQEKIEAIQQKIRRLKK